MARNIEGVAALSLSVSPQSSSLRLRLASVPDRRGAVDGGWWPRSRDAANELAELLAGLTGPLGAITRLTVNADDWYGIPRRIAVGDRVVKVGWSPDLDHVIIVTRREDEYLLLVVPPEAAEDAAHRALHQAAAGTGSSRPTEILSGCHISTAHPRTADGRTQTTTAPPGENWGRPKLRLVPSEPTGEHQLQAADDGFRDEPE